MTGNSFPVDTAQYTNALQAKMIGRWIRVRWRRTLRALHLKATQMSKLRAVLPLNSAWPAPNTRCQSVPFATSRHEANRRAVLLGPCQEAQPVKEISDPVLADFSFNLRHHVTTTSGSRKTGSCVLRLRGSGHSRRNTPTFLPIVGRNVKGKAHRRMIE